MKGIFGFVWNFIMFIGCFIFSHSCVALLGAGDLLVAVSLLVSAVKQAMFLPTTAAACGGALDWRNGTDGRNYFSKAEWDQDAWEAYGPAQDICSTMVQTWAATVSMV